MKTTKRVYFMMLVVLFLTSSSFLNVFAQKSTSSKRVGKTIACNNNDLDCMVRNANDCGRSSLTNHVSQRIFEQEFSQTVYYEIKGGTQDRCKFYMKILDWQVKTLEISKEEKEEIKKEMIADGFVFTEQTAEQKKAAQEMQRSVEKRLKNFIGTDGICTFKSADLTAIFGRWKNGRFSSADYKEGNCRGTYFVPANGYNSN